MFVNGSHKGAGLVDTGDIAYSLRARSGASAYLSRTFGAPTNNTSWAFSCFLKLGSLNTFRAILSAGSAILYLTNGNALSLYNSGTLATSTDLKRDPSGHGHMLWRSNGTNIKAYWNNVEVLSYTGTVAAFNSAVAHNLCRYGAGAADYFDGYISRVCFVDGGGSLTPGDFAYLNTQTNAWVTKSQGAIKAVVDAGGTNSFMLDFDNGSSLTTLGYDKSAKGNNWTLNNFSITAGATYDWVQDTPSNNYCVLNPLNQSAAGEANNGNLMYYHASTTTWNTVIGSMAPTSGKWYWEVLVSNIIHAAPSEVIIGMVRSDTSVVGSNYFAGSTSTGYGYASVNGNKLNGSSVAYGAQLNDNDVLGILWDADAGALTFYKNNVSQGTAFSGITGVYAPAVSSLSGVCYVNFGQRPFAYSPPTGYKALCTGNLPTPTGAALEPKKHFDAVVTTGSTGTRSVSGLLFPPDLVTSKNRAGSTNRRWGWIDSVRGVNKTLCTNLTDAEVTSQTDLLTAFNSDGFTVGADAGFYGWNGFVESYVHHCWKAGGAPVTNTAGSITSQVSANVAAGFSIVTYTGTGANATVGHGLGKVPSLIIFKNRNPGGAYNWVVWHDKYTGGVLAQQFTNLNTTSAVGSDTTLFNNTLPTANVFSIGTAANTNENTKGHVAYCFAEIEGYSKAFSVVGNSSADGAFVYLGFRPRWIIFKNITNSSQWVIFDTARNTINVISNGELLANQSSAEGSGAWGNEIDIVSNGFKFRGSDANNFNITGNTYVGFAIAEQHIKYANAR